MRLTAGMPLSMRSCMEMRKASTRPIFGFALSIEASQGEVAFFGDAFAFFGDALDSEPRLDTGIVPPYPGGRLR